MRNSSSRYLHLVHPRPIQWESVISAVQKDLNLPLVPYGQWLASLERVKADPGSQDENELITRYPALKILEFFADAGKDAVASDLFSGAEESFLGTQDIYGTGITEQSTSQNNVYEHGDQSHVTAGQATYDYNEGDYDPYSEGWYDEHNQWHPYEEAAVTASTTVNTAGKLTFTP